MDDDLKRRISDVIDKHFHTIPIERVWADWVKLPMSQLGSGSYRAWDYAKRTVAAKCETSMYNEMYDLIELVVRNMDGGYYRSKFVDDMNEVLAENMSAWRIVGDTLVRAMADVEIGAVREAASLYEENADYAKSALRAMGPSDPDFENAIAQAAKMAENTLNKIGGRGRGLKSKLGSVVGKLDIPENLVESFRQVDTFANEFARHPHDKSTYEADRNDSTLVLVWFSAMSNYLHWRWRDRGG